MGMAISGLDNGSPTVQYVQIGLLGAIQRPVSVLKLGGMLVMLIGLAIMLFGDRLSERFLN